jgi:hypothetical protein
MPESDCQDHVVGIPEKPSKAELIAALVAKIAELRAALGAKHDKSSPRVVERVTLKKFDHTPLPGEDLTPLETVIIEDGRIVAVIPGNGQGETP